MGKTPPFVVVVSPLLMLMQDQAHKLRMVPKAKPRLLSEESTLKDSSLVVSGWTHILASPEAYSIFPSNQNFCRESALSSCDEVWKDMECLFPDEVDGKNILGCHTVFLSGGICRLGLGN